MNALKSWPVSRKETKWITKPSPGPHPLKLCIPINIVLKNILNYAKTTIEVKKILNNKDVLVDKKVIKDHKHPLGLFDILEFPKINEYFRVIISENGKFILQPIKKEDTSTKICKIIGKTILKGNKLQINLYDSKNILVDKDEYKVGDSIILDLEQRKIKSHLKLEKNTSIYLTGGKPVGKTGTLEKIEKDVITVNIDKKKIKTSKRYAFVIPKDLIKND